METNYSELPEMDPNNKIYRQKCNNFKMWKVRTGSGYSGNTVCRLGVVSSLVLKAIID